MQINIMNGALHGDSFTDIVSETIAGDYAGQGHTITMWRLRDHKLAYCLGCFQCWTHTPGLCRIDDASHKLTRSIIRCDLQVYISPVTFGGFSSEIKKVLDRSICLIMPYFTHINGEVHHEPRYERFPDIQVYGVLPEPSPTKEAILRKLVERNAINMHAPAFHVDFVYSTGNMPENIRTVRSSDSHTNAVQNDSGR